METATSQEYQDLLVRGLAHRMNNILTVFHGYVGLMLDNKGLDPATRDGLSRIKAGASAATELIDRTHALVRKPNIVWREVDLCELVRNLSGSMNALCPKGATLEIAAPEKLSAVWADASRLRTSIMELVRNACEAVAERGKTGKIRLELSEAAADRLPPDHEGEATAGVCLAVVDNGRGVAEENRERIFEPFFSTKRKQNATGLGLNVAEGLVQQCGGVLHFVGQPGETRFEILLRRAPVR